MLTLVESILENPELILRRQLDKLKDRAVAEMKAEGVEYEQRMEELEKLEYPKPLRDFIYDDLQRLRRPAPLGRRGEHPPEVDRARDVRELPLVRRLRARVRAERSEGLLLRHLNSVYKVLSQTVPDAVEDRRRCVEMELYLRDDAAPGRLEPARTSGSGCAIPTTGRSRPRRRRGEELRPPGAETAAPDITRDAKAFTAAIRTRIFTFLRAWAIGDHAAALDALDDPPPAETRRRARGRRSGSDRPSRPTASSTTASASIPRRATSGTRTSIRPTTGRTWRVQQVLVDPALHNDWVAEFEVDLAASREANQPVLWLRGIGPIG